MVAWSGKLSFRTSTGETHQSEEERCFVGLQRGLSIEHFCGSLCRILREEGWRSTQLLDELGDGQ